KITLSEEGQEKGSKNASGKKIQISSKIKVICKGKETDEIGSGSGVSFGGRGGFTNEPFSGEPGVLAGNPDDKLPVDPDELKKLIMVAFGLAEEEKDSI